MQADSLKNDSPGDSPSTFPLLSDDLSRLPTIPGGWTERQFQLPERHLHLSCPADPDLFLEDVHVLEANDRNDYTPYWAFLWPSSILMSQLVHRSPWDVGSEVLELGAGIGLIGLAASARGDRVVFSDYDQTALHLCRINSARNGLPDPETLVLDWREPIDRQFRVIIGCEVTYDAPMHSVILDLLGRMLTENGICWLGDPGRYQSQFFYQCAIEKGFSVRILNQQLQEVAKPAAEGFQIFEIHKSTSKKLQRQIIGQD